MSRRALLRGLLVLLVAAVLGAQGAATDAPASMREPPVELTVLAASSLTEALPRVAAAWTAKGHPRVSFSFDASSRLARQVEAGAPVDAYFSADREWMDYLDQRGLVNRQTRVDLLGNRLVAVLPAGSGLAVAGPRDLGQPEVHHLAVAGENVPAGRYARAALGSLGAWAAVQGGW